MGKRRRRRFLGCNRHNLRERGDREREREREEIVAM
jgi:hypothetical protein